MVISTKKLSLGEIRPYFKEIMGNFIDSNHTWQIQITLKLSFISIKDTSEERYM